MDCAKKAFDKITNMVNVVHRISSDNKDIVTLQRARQLISLNENTIKGFYLDCRVRNLRPTTIEGYLVHLKTLLKHAFKKDKALIELDVTNVKEIITEYQENGASPYTINAKLRVLKLFENFCVREGIIEGSAWKRIKLLKVDEKHVVALLPEQIDLFIRAGFDKTTFCGHRNTMIVKTLYDIYCRVTELCNLTLSDIDISGGLITIRHSKNRSVRVAPIAWQTAKQLNHYLIKHRQYVKSDYFFCTQTGGQMTRERVLKMLARTSAKTGIKIYPHLLRYTGLTEALKNGIPDKIAQRIGGWKDPRVMDRYCRLSGIDLRESANKFTPAKLLK